MKIILWLVLIVALYGFGSLSAQAGSTNDDILVVPYDELTSDVLKILKQEHDDLMALQTSDRALKTKLWLQLLNHIDQIRNLDFDFKSPTNLYFMNVGVPLDPANPKTFGVIAGVDPVAIKDPDTRRMLEEAIRINHEKYLRFNFESQLKWLAKTGTMYAVQYFKSAYMNTPHDAKELMGYLEIVTDAKHKEELKNQLKDYADLSQ